MGDTFSSKQSIDLHPIFDDKSQHNYFKQCIVYGYINKTYKSNMPRDIADVITHYYQYDCKPKFYRDKHGKYLSFVSDTKIMKTQQPDGEYLRCSIGLMDKCITNKMCDKFQIDFKIDFPKYNISSSLHIGYASSFKDVIHWNDALGELDNGDIGKTYGIYINGRSTMTLHKTWGLPLPEMLKYPPQCYKSKTYFQNGDIFTLSFDFVKDCIDIYHNYRYADTTPLDGRKSIIPGVSVWDYQDSIEIVECRFS